MLAPCPPSTVNVFSVPKFPLAPKGTVFDNRALDTVPALILFAFSPALLVRTVTPPTVGVPVKLGEASGAFVAILFVIVVEKLASSPNAAANSLSVLRVPGAESTKFAI